MKTFTRIISTISCCATLFAAQASASETVTVAPAGLLTENAIRFSLVQVTSFELRQVAKPTLTEEVRITLASVVEDAPGLLEGETKEQELAATCLLSLASPVLVELAETRAEKAIAAIE